MPSAYTPSGDADGELPSLDLIKQLGVALLDGQRILHGSGGDGGPAGGQFARLSPRWQFCHLGLRVEVGQPALSRLLPDLSVLIELDHQGGPL